jgi:ribosome-associated toxin RatA of RatAB toxin-antitoxin module
MVRIERSALVMHTAEQMFDLVCDVKSYPEFFPWCVDAHVEAESDDELVAGLTIRKAGMIQKFTTNNQKSRGEFMTMELVDGPFSKLHGKFSFQVLSPEACKVVFELEFEVAGKLMSKTLGPVFKQAANTMVDAFVQRAGILYASK